MSPFDITKSILSTTDNIYTTDNAFNKEYNSFMINRILSNSPQTALFADAMNQYPNLDKKLQYDFYRLGIPKTKSRTSWTKKEATDINQEHLDVICSEMQVSPKRAIELYSIIGAEAIDKFILSKGGKK